MRAWGILYFIYASARVEMDRENYKGARERLENVIHLFYKDVQNEYYYYLGETYFYLEEFELAGRYVLKAMEVLQSKSSLPGLDSSKKDLRIIDETCTSSQYTLSRYSCLLGHIYLSTIQGDSPENNNTFEKALSAFAEALRRISGIPDILMWIAITYRKRGEYSRSIELLENIIAINPEIVVLLS